jgi:hypothetical protein
MMYDAIIRLLYQCCLYVEPEIILPFVIVWGEGRIFLSSDFRREFQIASVRKKWVVVCGE